MKYFFFFTFLLLSSLLFGQGGGMTLYEVGNTGIGNASAGASALARDASSAYTNPAAMTELTRNFLSIGIEALPLTLKSNITSPVDNGQGTNDMDGGGTSMSGAVYWAHKLNDKFTLGGALNAVAASSLNYDTNWIGRYIVTDVVLGVINFEPSVGYRLNDKWSFGLGLNIYYSLVDANLRMINYNETPITKDYTQDLDINLDATDFLLGFSAGVHFRPYDGTRFGLTYRMGNTFDLEGNLEISDKSGMALPVIRELAAQIPVVNGINLGFAQRINKWDVLADIGWADWSQFEEVPIYIQLDGLVPDVTDLSGALPEEWQDSWHFGVGANYYLDDQWTFQAGISHDTKTADDEAQTINVPSWALTRYAAGAIYNINDKFDVGLHYSYGAADEGGEFNMLEPYSSSDAIESFTGTYDKVALQCILFSFSYKY